MTHPLTTSALSFDEYQQLTAVTAIYPEAGSGSAGALAYVTLGLVGEAGEIANKVKKVLRDSEGVVSDEIRETLVGELGDVMWYVARLATELQTSSGLVAQENLNKLLDRKERGVLKGSGDTR
jgi:NTP pyrophosphatase (non-canonical NTP hydrolase)